MIPLKDDNPLLSIKFQTITLFFIVICVVIFMLGINAVDEAKRSMIMSLGVVPANLLIRHVDGAAWSFLAPLTLLSSMFIHADILHLFGNMLYLWIFGDNVEDAMGHAKFFVFFILVGVIAGFIYALVNVHSVVPAIGASGAISGVLGAYFVLYPRASVLVLIFGWYPLRLPAVLVLGSWIGLQLLHSNGGGGVAWWAHIGGFFAGAILIFLFKNKDVTVMGDGQSL
ncbi:hypothetical protein TI04_08625 [Achromatium sp. WMS2]|nr:hypothetical protein TI04_08625 [Achromatium sp. WMS2]